MHLDRLSIEDTFDLMNSEDAGIAKAVALSKNEICEAIKLVVAAFKSGGRLIYVGAGTSGRLGVLDAAECPPTFMSDPNMVQGVIAGGTKAITQSVEGAEDSPELGANEMRRLNVTPKDVVFGIATGGTTPYVRGAIKQAKELRAKTVMLACVSKEQWSDEADVSIRVITGPEVLTGSTRLKAGTATKMVLNIVTTAAMCQMGKVYQNLMVDVNTKGNAKLVDRGIRIIETITGCSAETANTLLKQANGSVKVASIIAKRQVDQSTAKQLLFNADEHLAQVIGEDSAINHSKG